MTLMVPLKLAVMVGITDLLKTITIANGYQHDLGDYTHPDTGATMSRVFRGRNIFGYDDPMPMVAILENPHSEPHLQEHAAHSGVNVGPKELLIQGFVENDPAHPTDPAHYLLADVQQCLAIHKTSQLGVPRQTYFGVSKGVSDFYIGTGVVRPPDDVSAYANFWLLLTVIIGEDMTKPFDWS
jgi:hypothetical protein